MDPRVKFLIALRNLYNAGAIKTVKQAYDFAKNQFGQLDDLFKRQIEQVFKKPIDKAPKPGEGGITSIKNPPKKEIPSQAPGTSPVMQRLEKGVETLKEMKQPGMDLTTGLTRTIARSILNKKGIQIPERADPITVLEDNFGGDVLINAKDVAEELIELERRGISTKSIDEVLEQAGMFDVKINKDAPKGMTDDELMKKIIGDVDEAYGVDDAMKRKLDQEDIDKAIEQEDILLNFDPKDRKPSAMGGFQRTGFEDGTENPKNKKGVMSVVKKIPRVGKLAAGLETIMSKFGTDAIGTLEDFYKKGKLKTDPNVEKFRDDKKAIFDFNMRQLNKTEADANREMRKGKFTAAQVLLQRLKNTLKNEKDPYVQENFPTFIKEIEANPKLAEDPKVQEAFGLRDLPENQRLVEYNDGTFDFYTQGSKKGMGSVKALADEFGISMEEAMKIKTMEPEDQILEIERRRRLNRKLNSQGGLQYLMGL
jgi:soluble cytochrome b562